MADRLKALSAAEGLLRKRSRAGGYSYGFCNSGRYAS